MYPKNTTCHRTYLTTTKHLTLKTASTTTISRTTLIPDKHTTYTTGKPSTSIVIIPVKTVITYVKTVTTVIPTQVCVTTPTIYASPSSYSSVYFTGRSDAQLESREFHTSLPLVHGSQASTASVVGGMAGIFLLGVVIYYIFFKKAAIRLNGNEDRHIPEIVEQA